MRQSSNVFAMFDQKQIAEFKEAFSMIDHDNDGFIDKDDLKDMLSSLGTPVCFACFASVMAAPGGARATWRRDAVRVLSIPADMPSRMAAQRRSMAVTVLFFSSSWLR